MRLKHLYLKANATSAKGAILLKLGSLLGLRNSSGQRWVVTGTCLHPFVLYSAASALFFTHHSVNMCEKINSVDTPLSYITLQRGLITALGADNRPAALP